MSASLVISWQRLAINRSLDKRTEPETYFGQGHLCALFPRLAGGEVMR